MINELWMDRLKTHRYKWCSSCGGCILESARWCRYCYRELASATQAKPPLDNSLCSMRSAYLWLGRRLDKLLHQLPESPIKDFLRDAARTDEIRNLLTICEDKPSPTVSACEPPKEAIRDLLRIVALHLSSRKGDWRKLIAIPRLAVLGITAASIQEELEQRSVELKGGRLCPFCSEFNNPNIDGCHYCGSDFVNPPVNDSPIYKSFDDDFLCDALVCAAFDGKPNNESPETISPALNECGLDERAAARILDERKAEVKVSAGFPLTPWQKKILSVGLRNDQPPSFKVQLLCDMGRYCRMVNRYNAAELLLCHGIDVGETGNEEQEDGLKLAVADCWGELGKLYAALGKSVQSAQCRQEQKLCYSTCGDFGAFLGNVDQQLVRVGQLMSAIASGINDEAQESEVSKVQEDITHCLATLAQGNLPEGLGDELHQIASLVLAIMHPSFVAVHELNAFQHAKHLMSEGDLLAAEELIVTGLARIASDDTVSKMARIQGLNQLALIQKAKGHNQEAMHTFATSKELAQNLPEVGALRVNQSMANTAKALNLWSDAAKYYEPAVKQYDENHRKRLAEKGREILKLFGVDAHGDKIAQWYENHLLKSERGLIVSYAEVLAKLGDQEKLDKARQRLDELDQK